MIKVIIRNRNLLNKNPAPQAELMLPATSYDVQDAYERAWISDTDECEILFVSTAEIFGLNDVFDEYDFDAEEIPVLNLLAHILIAMSDDELFVLDAMMYHQVPITPGEVINLTFSLDGIYLNDDILTMKQLGKYLVQEEYVDIPGCAEPFVSYKKIAKKFLKQNTNCSLTPLGFLEDDRDEDDWGEWFDDSVPLDMCQTTEINHDETVFTVGLIARKDFLKNYMEMPDSMTIINLPATEETINESFAGLGVKNRNEVLICQIMNRNQIFDKRFDPNSDIHALNELAKRIIRMDVVEFCKYKAILEFWGLINTPEPKMLNIIELETAIEEAGNLDSYGFVTGTWYSRNTSYGSVACFDFELLQEHMECTDNRSAGGEYN